MAGLPGRGCSWLGKFVGARAEQLRSRGSAAGLCDNRRLPNKRLKLAAPGVFGRIPFVTVHVRRRSLGAIR